MKKDDTDCGGYDPHEKTFEHLLTILIERFIMTIADEIKIIKDKVTAIEAGMGTGGGTVDLTPVLTAQAATEAKVDAVKNVVDHIDSELTLTPTP